MSNLRNEAEKNGSKLPDKSRFLNYNENDVKLDAFGKPAPVEKYTLKDLVGEEGLSLLAYKDDPLNNINKILKRYENEEKREKMIAEGTADAQILNKEFTKN